MRWLVFFLAAGCLSAAVDFEKQIKPLFERHCLLCHGTTGAGNVYLEDRAKTLTPPWIVKGRPERSLLYRSLLLPVSSAKMMPPGFPLPEAERELVKQWILEGAVWPDHVQVGQASKPAPQGATVAEKIDFVKQVKPLLEQQCVACHGAGQGAGGIRLHTREAALRAPGILPGNPGKSAVYTTMVLPDNHELVMPPVGALPKEQSEIIRLWIEQGAEWPAGVTVGVPAKQVSDENETVKKIHERITRTSKEKTVRDMKAYRTVIPNTDVGFDMLPVPPGEFLMGSPESEGGRKSDEGPQRKIRIEPFWMHKTEVTWDEYRLFMFAQSAKEDTNKDGVVDAISRPTKPYVEMSFGMGVTGFPAISMTQHAANKYAEWLSAKTGHFYRLPTEAEWEYACRAGTSGPYSTTGDLSEVAWSSVNSGGKYQLVGKKKPNLWGLHDMHGNVMEWTLDQYGSYADSGPSTWRPATKAYPHAVRGGSWNDPPDRLRCAARVPSSPDWKMQDPNLPQSIWYHTEGLWLGFRLVRPLKIPSVMEMYKYWNSGVERD